MEDEVLKQIDGLLKSMNSFLSDRICSEGIRSHTSQKKKKSLFRTFLNYRKVRRNKIIVEKMTQSYAGRGLCFEDRTMKHILRAGQVVLHFIQ